MNATSHPRHRPERHLTPEEDRAFRFANAARAAGRAAAMAEAALDFAADPAPAELAAGRRARIYADTLTIAIEGAGDPHAHGWADRMAAAVLKLRTEAVHTITHPAGGRSPDLVAVARRVELATREFDAQGSLF